MLLDNWASRWRIPPQALEELRALMMPALPVPVSIPGVSEAAAQQNIRLDEARRGNILWRNNNGATFDESGRMIRYGLANDSPSVSKKVKSSDLIGITPRIITVADIGHTWGVFTSYEVKRPGWTYRATDREQAQLAWINLILSKGGIGKFMTGPEGGLV